MYLFIFKTHKMYKHKTSAIFFNHLLLKAKCYLVRTYRAPKELKIVDPSRLFNAKRPTRPKRTSEAVLNGRQDISGGCLIPLSALCQG